MARVQIVHPVASVLTAVVSGWTVPRVMVAGTDVEDAIDSDVAVAVVVLDRVEQVCPVRAEMLGSTGRQ